jgi:hypothetical protein
MFLGVMAWRSSEDNAIPAKGKRFFPGAQLHRIALTAIRKSVLLY